MSTLSPVSIKTIVVATDLSPSADVAVEQAAIFAKRCGAKLWILHVFNDGFWASIRGIYDPELWSAIDPVLSARNRLSQQVKDVADRCGISVTGETRTGRIASEIARFIDECHANLIVIGKHGENSVGDTFIGGTALKVLKRSHIPVLLVHRNADSDYSKVLIATDFSECAYKAARYAFGIFSTSLHYVVHTYDVAFQGCMRMAGASDDAIESYYGNELQNAERKMLELRLSLAPDESIHVEWMNVRGYPGVEVITQSEKLDVGLIVIGKRGFVQLEDHLLGSVTQNVLYRTDRNVLLVPENLDEYGPS